jgi:hypothetical protein
MRSRREVSNPKTRFLRQHRDTLHRRARTRDGKAIELEQHLHRFNRRQVILDHRRRDRRRRFRRAGLCGRYHGSPQE